jgi:disulfide bond formation protein DsbB
MDLTDIGVRFFSALGVFAMAATALALVALVVHRLAPTNAAAKRVVDLGHQAGLQLATAVAVTTTLGSLFMSEVAGFVPCELCWYQRIFAWPLSLILTVAAVRRDRTVWTYALPLCAVGGAVSIWHVLIERVPALADSTACDATTSCTVRWVWEFGFVSIPLLALTCFMAVATGTWMARPSGRAIPATDEPASSDTPAT